MKIDWNKYFTSKTISALIVVISGVLLYFTLLRFDDFLSMLSWFFSIFQPFILGFIIAYLINFFVVSLEKRVFFKLKNPKMQRIFAMIAGYTLAIIILGLFLFMLVPQTLKSITVLITNVPDYIENLLTVVNEISVKYGWQSGVQQWLNQTLLYFEKGIPDFISWIVPYTVNITTALSKVLLNIIIAVIVSIYFIGTKEKFFAQIKKLLYANCKTEKVNSILSFTAMTNSTFSNFICGKLLDSLIIGIICFVFLSIFKFPFALLISVIVGVTNIIPFFGPFFGAIPSFFILLIADPTKALWFPLFILVLQQLDGNVIGPKILGLSIGISAIWIVFSIVISGSLFGFVGMLVGVPVFAIIYTVLRMRTNKKLEDKGLSTKTDDYASEENKIRF
ncbi:MAG: AI-2E family transporter [Clostridiales bacterium]